MTATVAATATANLSDLPPDIIKSHILTHLHGPDLASAASSSTSLRRLSSSSDLWSAVCHATWPSTATPQLTHLISTFPGGGARSFFSHAFPTLSSTTTSDHHHQTNPPPSELISAIDIHHENTDNPIFSKTEVTETVSDWFRCSPFRIDLLDPKDVVQTPIKHPTCDESCNDLMSRLKLSWILIDPVRGRAVNLSSQSPVDVQRHWLTGEVQVRYATVIGEEVQCRIAVTCAGSEEGGMMQVREVGLEMEDLDGKYLKGKDSLVFLQKALEGKKGRGKLRVQEAKRRYNRFLELRRQRKERRERVEAALDFFCLAFGVGVSTTFLALWCFLSWT